MEINDVNPFYRDIKRRIYSRKQNCCIGVVGSTGTGKSWAALKIAVDLDPTFTIETLRERVIVDPKQLARMVKEKGKLQQGNVVILDEIGTTVQSRDFFSATNKMISSLLQIFRFKQLILIVTLPNLAFTDVNVRRLLDYTVETQRIDFEKNVTYARVHRLSYSKINPKQPYKERFRGKDEHGYPIIFDKFTFPRVDIKLGHAYDKYSHEFKGKILEDSLIKLVNAETKRDRREFDPNKLAKHVLKHEDKYVVIRKDKFKVNRSKLQFEHNIGDKNARKVAYLVEKELNSE